MVDEADALRVELLARAREVSNGHASFNALQYPLGAGLVYEKLRGAANRALLLPATVAAGVYGYVNAGVVDREHHYLREAFQLHCAIVKAAPLLYLDAEVNGVDAPPTPAAVTTTTTTSTSASHFSAADAKASARTTNTTQTVARHVVSEAMPFGATRPYSLVQLTALLKVRIDAFDKERISVSGLLEGRAGTPPPADARERRVARASGRAGGTSGSNTTQGVKDLWLQQAEMAMAMHQQLVELRGQINTAGSSLRSDLRDIDQEAQSLLSAGVPLPRNPKATLDELAASATALKAQAGAPGPAALDPVLHGDLRAGLSTTATKKADEFASKQGRELLLVYRDAHAWWTAHSARVQTTTTLVERLKCRDKPALVPARAPASAPAAATKPATSNTPTAPETGAAPASGTTLPNR